MHEFRIDIGTWFSIAAEDAPSGRSSLTATVAGNTLFVFGGYNGSTVLNDFHEFRFDPVSIPPGQLVNDLRSLVNNAALSDVSFRLDSGEIFYATKGILAVRSEYFRQILFGGNGGGKGSPSRSLMKDSGGNTVTISETAGTVNAKYDYPGPESGADGNPNGPGTVTATEVVANNNNPIPSALSTISTTTDPIPIPDISPDCFHLVLLFFYTDQLLLLSQSETRQAQVQIAVELLGVSDRFLLRRLKSLTEDALRKMLDYENCIPILLTATKQKALGLKELCMDFLLLHENKMKTMSSFKRLTEEPILLYELLMRRKAIADHSLSGPVGPGSMSPLSNTHATPEQSPQASFAHPRRSGTRAPSSSSLFENLLGGR